MQGIRVTRYGETEEAMVVIEISGNNDQVNLGGYIVGGADNEDQEWDREWLG